MKHDNNNNLFQLCFICQKCKRNWFWRGEELLQTRMFDVSLKGMLELYLSHFFRMKRSLDGVAKIRAYIVLYTWRLLNLLYTNTHIREWGKAKREWGIFKREWDVCEKYHVVEVFLIYLKIISRASRCLKHSCFRSCHCHIQLNYNAYSSCGLKMFFVVCGEEERLGIFIFGRCLCSD